MQKEGKKRVIPSTKAEKPGLHPNFTCVRGDKGCRNPIPAGMLRKPGDLPQVCPRPKMFKRLATRDTLHGSRPNLPQREPTVELCPPHPRFWIKVRTRRDAPEGEKKTQLYMYKQAPASAPAFACVHASGRAGQHFDKFRCSCPIWHSLNFKVMPRVSYEHGTMNVILSQKKIAVYNQEGKDRRNTLLFNAPSNKSWRIISNKDTETSIQNLRRL